MKRLKYILGLSLLFVSFSIVSNAQTVDDQFIKACEQTADLAKRLTIENDGLKAQLALANEKITLEKERTAVANERGEFYKVAYEKGTKIDVNSEKVIENLRIQVNDYRIENKDLRAENDKLRGSRTVRTLIGTGVGFAAGYYLGNKNNNTPVFIPGLNRFR